MKYLFGLVFLISGLHINGMEIKKQKMETLKREEIEELLKRNLQTFDQTNIDSYDLQTQAEETYKIYCRLYGDTLNFLINDESVGCWAPVKKFILIKDTHQLIFHKKEMDEENNPSLGKVNIVNIGKLIEENMGLKNGVKSTIENNINSYVLKTFDFQTQVEETYKIDCRFYGDTLNFFVNDKEVGCWPSVQKFILIKDTHQLVIIQRDLNYKLLSALLIKENNPPLGSVKIVNIGKLIKDLELKNRVKSAIMLACTREHCQDTLLNAEYFPLDMFRLIMKEIVTENQK